MFLKSREDFWVATISKTSTFEVPKFSENFSPLRLGSACCLGLRFPRQHTAAHGSLRRPRFRGRAAPGGEGGRGCEDQPGPWPRRRILVGKPHEALGFRCEEVNEDVDGSLMVPLFGGYFFTIFWKACQNICTNVWCCCLWTQLYCSYTLVGSFLDSRILV